MSRIDYCLSVDHEVDVQKTRAELLRRFECDDISEVEKHIGYNAERWRKQRQVMLT